VHDVLRSPGRPLDAAVRAFFEPRLGHDFATVRVHTDAPAASSAGAVNALAYAVGPDLVFGAGRYAPGTVDGMRLLAHELVHVGQQAQTRVDTAAGLRLGRPHDAAERAAAVAAERMVPLRATAVPCR
jgi:hypothetical protein